MLESVPEEQRRHYPAFPALTTPTPSHELVLHEESDPLRLGTGGFESHDLPEKLDRFIAQFDGFFFAYLLHESLVRPDLGPPTTELSGPQGSGLS
jgi:hypothetical protein